MLASEMWFWPVTGTIAGTAIVAESGEAPLHDGRTQQPQQSHSGSINEVGPRFQPFRINDWEMVDYT
jgi:hypothetical protein